MNPLCKICGRVLFGDVVRLAAGSWRHAECSIGSEAWADYYNALPEGSVDKTKLAEFFRCFIGPVESVVIEEEGSNNQTEGA